METELTRVESEQGLAGRGGSRRPNQVGDQAAPGAHHEAHHAAAQAERREKHTDHGAATARITTAPMTMDMLARQDDKPATEAVPAEVQAALASHWTVVTLPAGMPTPLPSEAAGRGVRNANHLFVLPEGSFVGTAVTETRRHALGSLPVPAGNPEPHRPAWVPLTHTPRISGVDRVLLRRRNGRLVVPTDSGRAYGEYPARAPFYPSSYPWNCIGRIFVWADATAANWSWYGSAVLIGARAILTAGHIVPWGSGSNWKALFVAGYYDGSSTSGAGGQSWVTNAHGWNPGGSVVAHDMAVMRLQDPLGSWLGYFGTKAYDGAWEGGHYWHLVGYPTAITSERPSWQGGISVLDDDEDGDAQEIEHHGDDTGGDSGGPFFGFWSGAPYAIGTVSGYEVISGGIFGIGNEDNNIAAGGDALNAIVHYARDTWT